ncbi:MAG: hypothetical protein HOO06_05355 [Bdellovibrionaceae bacterium]|jgi:hypothetical protein|nr:hypothetical protein [Pseudobdellovibrionaceae bacterium]
MKSLIIVILGLLIVGCKGVEGKLKVAQPFQVVNKRGKIESINVGNYKVHVKTKKRYLKMTIVDSYDRSDVVKFKLVDSNKIPRRNGEFILSSEETGQPVDLLGAINTTEQWSREKSKMESCEYMEREHQCYGGRYGPRCTWVDVRKRGWQSVTYRVKSSERRIILDITEPNDSEVKANFYAENHWQEKIYSYKAICR